MNADDLVRMNDWLLSSGMDIARMNRVRKTVSMIKGGRLANYLTGRPTVGLLISDVIGDDPAVIGSGLLAATAADIMGLADINLPGWFSALTELADPMPSASDACFDNIQLHVIASLNKACAAAAAQADALGYDVFLHPDLFCCDAESTGRRLASTVIEGGPLLHVWGGETVVTLPEHPGRGGRNQHLALAAATKLQGHSDCLLLAAGTDGSDGPTPDAGALVDGGSLARGELDGLDARECLQAFDSGRFLEASGDLISTGPTGTNVMDIVLGLKTH
jgi:hydroxypyruvate reductase